MIGIIGAGKLAGIIIDVWMEENLFQKNSIWALTRTQESALKFQRQHKIPTFFKIDSSKLKKTECLLLAVKPHQLEIVLNQLKENGLSSKTIIISILAGVTPQDIENKLKQKNPVITLMTNTAAQKKQAMSALMWGRHLQKTQKVFARKLAKTLGEAIEIKTSDFHSFTAAAGSGIAFVYKLLQSYTLATEKLGLNLKTSELITRQIFKAAITMSENNQYDELIKMVATPGGCTEVGLHTLDKMGLQKIISGTLENTATKAKKLMKK